MADIQTIVGKVITDPVFCKELKMNPEQTLKGEGVTPTPEILDAINSLDETSIHKLAVVFSKKHPAIP